MASIFSFEVEGPEDVPRFVWTTTGLAAMAGIVLELFVHLVILQATWAAASTSVISCFVVATIVAIPVSLRLGNATANLAVARREAEWRARFDERTGLPNGRTFDEAMTILTGPSVLVLIEIDNFGALRHRGPRFSEVMVSAVAAELAAAFGANGRLFRNGVKRFAFLADGPHPDAAFDRADAARAAVARLRVADGRERVGVTISCGVASDDGENSDLLQISAERALAKAKDGGCNQVRMDYDPGTLTAVDLDWGEPPAVLAG